MSVENKTQMAIMGVVHISQYVNASWSVWTAIFFSESENATQSGHVIIAIDMRKLAARLGIAKEDLYINIALADVRRHHGIGEHHMADEYAARSLEVLIKATITMEDMAAPPLCIMPSWIRQRPAQQRRMDRPLTADGMRMVAAWTERAFDNCVASKEPEPLENLGITVGSGVQRPDFILATDASVEQRNALALRRTACRPRARMRASSRYSEKSERP